MSTDTNQDGGDTENAEGTTVVDEIKLSKSEYEELVKTKADFGSLKRDFKDLKKSMETKEPEKKEESTELDYSQKAFLKASGLNTAEEMQLARDFARRTGDTLDAVLEDDIFKGRLEKMRTTKANESAAEGGTNRTGGSGGKNTVDYWLNKLGPDDQLPTGIPRDVAYQVVEARRNKGKNAKMFYND